MPVTNFDALATSAGTLNPNVQDTFTFFSAGNQTTGVLKWQWVVPFAATITDVRAYIGTAPVGSTFILDCNKNGTTLFTTQGNRPTIADGGNASTTTAPDVTALAAGDRVSVDIDAVGSGTAGANLSVSISFKRATVA
jgi:hypothetical protein